MSIYGMSLNNNVSLLERYIDDVFLESSINKRINVTVELRKLTKEAKKNNKAPSMDDYNKIISEIKKLNREEQVKAAKEMTKSFIGFYTLGCVYGANAAIFTSIAGIEAAFPLAALAGLSFISSLMSLNAGCNWFEGNKKLYSELLKGQSKAKKEKSKAEKLGDDERAEALQKVIDMVDNLRKNQKTQMYLANYKNDHPEKTKFSVAESIEFDVLSEDVDLLLEFKGNDVKNNTFIEVLKDVDNMLKTRADIIDTFEGACDKVFAMTKSVKADNIREAIEHVYKINKETEVSISKIEGYYPELTMSFIKKEVRSFNNKYSSITMNEKKKLAQKLKQYKKKMQDFGYKYEEESAIQRDWIKAIQRMENDDIKGSYELASYAQKWYAKIIQYVNESIELIDDIEKILDIERTEKSLTYKVLNIRKKNK